MATSKPKKIHKIALPLYRREYASTAPTCRLKSARPSWTSSFWFLRPRGLSLECQYLACRALGGIAHLPNRKPTLPHGQRPSISFSIEYNLYSLYLRKMESFSPLKEHRVLASFHPRARRWARIQPRVEQNQAALDLPIERGTRPKYAFHRNWLRAAQDACR
jgi:hypothetical protein